MTLLPDRPRVVFDCNVLIQGISNDSGPAGRAFELLQRNLIEVYTSRAVMKELRSVLQYPSVRRLLTDLDENRLDTFLQQRSFRSTFVRHVKHEFDYPRAAQDPVALLIAAGI